jgi:hypothetical protein
MKAMHEKMLGRRLILLKKRCPWMASLIQHCLESRDPRAYGALRLMITRLRMKAA